SCANLSSNRQPPPMCSKSSQVRPASLSQSSMQCWQTQRAFVRQATVRCISAKETDTAQLHARAIRLTLRNRNGGLVNISNRDRTSPWPDALELVPRFMLSTRVKSQLTSMGTLDGGRCRRWWHSEHGGRPNAERARTPRGHCYLSD